MKKTVFCIILLCVMVSFLPAKDFKLSEVTANIGKGAFTSGFDVTLKFKSEANLFEVTGNHERFYAVYFWRLPLKITAGICFGAFKNMPQTGPYIIASPLKFLSVFYWRGWSAGEPGKPQAKVNDFFESAGVVLAFRNLKISYVFVDFQGEKTPLPGICYAIAINPRFNFFAGIDYKVSEKLPLFRIGISHFTK